MCVCEQCPFPFLWRIDVAESATWTQTCTVCASRLKTQRKEARAYYAATGLFTQSAKEQWIDPEQLMIFSRGTLGLIEPASISVFQFLMTYSVRANEKKLSTQ